MGEILVVVAARGGSKGLPGKNTRPLAGKPLIAYSIQQALDWKRAKHVVVSTDSVEIAEIARRYGAEVPFMRPQELATDSARKELALRHALLKCEELYRENYEILVDLDVTAPVRTVADLENCLELFRRERPKTLFSVVRSHKNPYFNMVEENHDGRIEICKKRNGYLWRRQDAPIVYAMNASIYFYDRNYLVTSENPSPFSDHTRIYVMSDFSGVDIDRGIDFQFIEFLVKEGVVRL